MRKTLITKETLTDIWVAGTGVGHRGMYLGHTYRGGRQRPLNDAGVRQRDGLAEWPALAAAVGGASAFLRSSSEPKADYQIRDRSLSRFVIVPHTSEFTKPFRPFVKTTEMRLTNTLSDPMNILHLTRRAL